MKLYYTTLLCGILSSYYIFISEKKQMVSMVISVSTNTNVLLIN